MGYIAELRKLVGSRPLIMAGAGVLVLDGAGRLLLQKRVDNGLWSFVGGSMEPGETFEQTARRELWEEAGLEAGALRLLEVVSGPEFFYRYPNGDEVYNVGCCSSRSRCGVSPAPTPPRAWSCATSASTPSPTSALSRKPRCPGCANACCK